MIQVILLGANLCLLDEHEEGEINALVEDDIDLLSIDLKRLENGELQTWTRNTTWLWDYGVLYHAWSPYFFVHFSTGGRVCVL